VQYQPCHEVGVAGNKVIRLRKPKSHYETDRIVKIDRSSRETLWGEGVERGTSSLRSEKPGSGESRQKIGTVRWRSFAKNEPTVLEAGEATEWSDKKRAEGRGITQGKLQQNADRNRMSKGEGIVTR